MTAVYEIRTLYPIWNEKELPEEGTNSVPLPIYKKGGKINCVNDRGTSLYQQHTKLYTTYSVEVCSIFRRNYWKLSVCIRTKRSATDHISCIYQIHEKIGVIMRQYIKGRVLDHPLLLVLRLKKM